jgi:hypothetical protein
MRNMPVVVIALVGCSHSGNGSVSVDQLPAAFKRSFCDYIVRCGGFPDVATCLGANLGISINPDPSADAAVAQGKVLYDGAKVGACYDALASISCDSTSQDARSALADLECFGAVKGTVAGGGACAINAECISFSCNAPTCAPTQCCPGTCVGDTVPPHDVAIGQSCANGVSCATGAYCDTTTTTCAALKPASSTCASDQECDYELGCVGTPATCQSLPKLGEACPNMRCRDVGTHCSNGTCVPLGLPNAGCATSADCSQFYNCDATKHCVEGPHVNQSCAAVGCFDADTFCDSTSTCKPTEPDGGACTSGIQCQSGTCDTTALCATPAACT